MTVLELAPQTETTAFPETMPRPTAVTVLRIRKAGTRPTDRLVLTGFMGSGKTTIGRLVAKQLGWEFVDLDALIEKRTGMPVPSIFALHGEGVFRREETKALLNALRQPRTVIALGGGAAETLDNRLQLEQTPGTEVVYLAAPFATLAARCLKQAADPTQTARPNFADTGAAEMRYAKRLPLYLRLAHVMVDTDMQDPQETAAAVRAIVIQPEESGL